MTASSRARWAWTRSSTSSSPTRISRKSRISAYGSRRLLQFDRLLPTTQLQPIDFPQFNSIDTIDEQTAVRLGVRNRLQTKRDALTFDWMELDTFFQVNVYEPHGNSAFVNETSTLSNLFNQFTCCDRCLG